MNAADGREVHPSLPGDIWGRRETDRLIGTVHRLSDLYVRLLRHTRTPLEVFRRDSHTFSVVVTERTVEAADEDVVSLRLERDGTDPLPPWYPGAHIDLTLPSGRTRQYSLCGEPSDASHYRIAVRLIPTGGGGSREIHESLHVGARIETQSPRNAFPLAVQKSTKQPPIRFVAGGIGITPILPMIEAVDRLGIEWSLMYSGRTRESLAFLDRLAKYAGRVQLRFDDEHGIPTTDELVGDLPDNGTVYCCGPAPMIETLRASLATRRTIGLHYERFAPPPIIDGVPFEIELARDGIVLGVAADTSILDTLREVRRDLTYSCRQGFCGSCRLTVLDGQPVHRGGALSEHELAEGQFLPCVSRAHGGRLVLDV
ncbi:PDR/VanB family oxidoreductase [Rhodococcus sp. APC 3903]|uniref:PDR/VanB family oxidoreductase n=1 Tax=Rhodococcus sp. APC 3903 TaxID=3035193 RepID=UPI0025B55E5C|nr:PDR/VanB family oxidoreductase [Rhodococcus sp. APC 3903]MDN3460659.1 PDR/VanB family oxidoreductase [Rhodococcus sp. APC 3903]